MKKYLLFAIMAVVLGACSANNPDSKSGYIQKVQLSDEQIAEFKAIFNNTNELLKAYPNAVTVAILSTEELRAICPSTAICPQVDFSKQCIIFAPIELSSINDEIIDNALYFYSGNKVYEFQVEIQKCTECYPAIDHVYTYGIYAISPDEIKRINPTVQLVYK